VSTDDNLKLPKEIEAYCKDEDKDRELEEKKYPCVDCGKLRTAGEGGTTFTVCDECWDKSHKKPTSDVNKDKKPGRKKVPEGIRNFQHWTGIGYNNGIADYKKWLPSEKDLVEIIGKVYSDLGSNGVDDSDLAKAIYKRIRG